jgi:hypothetical protein
VMSCKRSGGQPAVIVTKGFKGSHWRSHLTGIRSRQIMRAFKGGQRHVDSG